MLRLSGAYDAVARGLEVEGPRREDLEELRKVDEGVAERAAQIFSAHADSYEMPRPDTWGGGSPGIDGPGEIRDQCPGNSSWEPPLSRYDFVEQFHALRTQITDPGALSRFDLWDAHVEVARHQTLVGCDWNTLEWCIDGIPAENASSAASAALALGLDRGLVTSIWPWRRLHVARARRTSCACC